MGDPNLLFVGWWYLALGLVVSAAWLAGEWVVRDSERPGSMPAVALAGFVAVNVPPLALIASATMVCGGSPSCL
jgi:hypothetical protein